METTSEFALYYGCNAERTEFVKVNIHLKTITRLRTETTRIIDRIIHQHIISTETGCPAWQLSQVVNEHAPCHEMAYHARRDLIISQTNQQ